MRSASSEAVVMEVLRIETLPLGSAGSHRAIVRWSDGTESAAVTFYADEVSFRKGGRWTLARLSNQWWRMEDLLGKTQDQIRSLHFRRDRGWLRSWDESGGSVMSMKADILKAADECVGNWLKFESFGWADAPDPRYWTRAELSHRDSSILDQSNAAVIERTLEETDPEGEDHYEISASHWAVGWTEGLAIRVFKDGTNELHGRGRGHGALGMPTDEDLTPCFRAFYELMSSLADYPVLDDEDYCRREHEDFEETLTESYGVSSDHVSAIATRIFLRDSISTSDDLTEDIVKRACADLANEIDPWTSEELTELKESLEETERINDILQDAIADFARGILDTRELVEISERMAD